MWNTPSGRRQLLGKERALFEAGLSSLLDRYVREYRLDESRELHVPVLDFMDRKLRRYVVGVGVSAILCPVSAPPRTQWREASALAVFRHVAAELVHEIEHVPEDQEPGDDPVTTWRTLVLEAWMEAGSSTSRLESCPGDAGHNQHPAAEDFGEWSLKIESLIDQVLWDRNCELHCEKSGMQCGRGGVRLETAWIPSHAIKHATRGRQHAKYFAPPPPINALRQQILEAVSA